MSVILIIAGSLVTALLGIGIVGGVILSIVSVVRLISGRGVMNGKMVGTEYRFLLSGICLLNAFALVVGGYCGICALQSYKAPIAGVIKQQSKEDGILTDFFQDDHTTENESNTNGKEQNQMNNILDDVTKASNNISPLSVIGLLLITTIGAVLMITLCTGGMAAMKKLWDKLFHSKK